MGAEEQLPEKDTRPLWLRTQQEQARSNAYTEHAMHQALDAKARGGIYAQTGDWAIPSNEGTGVSIVEQGARTKTIQPSVLWSPEQAAGEVKLEQMKLEEKAASDESLRSARARFKLITSTANKKLYTAGIVLLAAGVLAFKLLGL